MKKIERSSKYNECDCVWIRFKDDFFLIKSQITQAINERNPIKE